MTESKEQPKPEPVICRGCGQEIVEGLIPGRPRLWTAMGDPFCGRGAHEPVTS